MVDAGLAGGGPLGRPQLPHVHARHAAEAFLWRETDATRNSLTMAAHGGTYLRRQTVRKTLSPEELARISVARRPNGPVERTSVMALPPASQVANFTAVILNGAKPVLYQALALA